MQGWNAEFLKKKTLEIGVTDATELGGCGVVNGFVAVVGVEVVDAFLNFFVGFGGEIDTGGFLEFGQDLVEQGHTFIIIAVLLLYPEAIDPLKEGAEGLISGKIGVDGCLREGIIRVEIYIDAIAESNVVYGILHVFLFRKS